MDDKKKTIMLALIGVLVAIGIFSLLMWLKKPASEPVATEPTVTKREENVGKIIINVNEHDLGVRLSGNSSAQALYNKLAEGPITVKAEDYGGFEKVGELDFKLPENNTNLTTKVGDLILYQGNKLSLYYGENTYELTKLGEVDYALQPELKSILGDGAVTMVLRRAE